MCFNQPMSGFFAGIGLLFSIYMYYRTKLYGLAIGSFYFFLMELLQFFQYFYIDDCNSSMNKFLTFIGYLHICFQPLFAHVANRSASYKNKKLQKKLDLIIGLCGVGGVLLLSRFFIAMIPGYQTHTEGFQIGYNPDGTLKGYDSQCGRSPEWLRGDKLCTFKGKNHLAWSIPLADATYWIPNLQLHFFLMFVPFFLCSINFKKLSIDFKSFGYGVILLVLGPIFSRYFSEDKMEQPAIWCFFSIMQLFMMAISNFDQIVRKPDWDAIIENDRKERIKELQTELKELKEKKQ